MAKRKAATPATAVPVQNAAAPGYFETLLARYYPTLLPRMTEHMPTGGGTSQRPILAKLVESDAEAIALEEVMAGLVADRVVIADRVGDLVSERLAGHTAIDALILGVWLGQTGLAEFVARP